MNNYIKLKKRIKKNEGYNNKAYLDQLEYSTIGYGHLINDHDNISTKKIYPKSYLKYLFEKDFNKALNDFKRHYFNKTFSPNTKEVLIEMIFQLGIKKTLQFRKFNKLLNTNNLHLAALEMQNSLWYLQTPKRVNGLIKILLDHKDVK